MMRLQTENIATLIVVSMTISPVHQLQNGKQPKYQNQLDRYGAKFMHSIKKTPPQQYVQIHNTWLLYMSFCLQGKELHFKVVNCKSIL